MKSTRTLFPNRVRLIILVLFVSAAGLLTLTLHPAQPVRGMEAKPSQGTAAIEQLKKDGSYSSLAAALNAARYHVQYASQPGANRLWQASNPAQQFNTTFNSQGVRIAEDVPAKPQWRFGVKMIGYGYGDDLAQVGEGEVSA